MRNEYESVLPGIGQPVPQAIQAVAQAEARQLAARIQHAARSAAQALLAMQAAPGYWSGHLTADTTLESDFVLLELWLHPPEDDGAWEPPSQRKLDKAVRSILDRQVADGVLNLHTGWTTHFH